MRILITITVILLAGCLLSTPAGGGGEAIRWEVYTDEVWDFSIEYPTEWSVETQLENSGKPDYVIKKKIAFTGPEGPMIILDLWSNDRNLRIMEWYYAYAANLTTQEAVVPEVPNAEVGCGEAIQFYNPQHQSADQLVAVFRKDSLYFRLEYRISDQGQCEDVFQYMLASFK